MTSQSPARQYSPDGRYWWDGQAWQPTQPQQPTQPRVPLWRLAPVLALLLGTVGGGGIGAVAASVSTHPHGPSAPQALPANFPDSSHRYLAHVTVPFITDWMTKDNNYTCGPNPDVRAEYGGKQLLECSAPGDSKYDLYVDIEYDDESHVLAVWAACDFDPGATACSSLFGAFADTLIAQNSPDDRKKADDWATKNTDSDEATTFGGIRFDIALDPHFIHATAVS